MGSRFNLTRWVKVDSSLACLARQCCCRCNHLRAAHQVGRSEPSCPETAAQPPAEPALTLSQAEVRTELIQVVESQLSAFRKDDYPAAYQYAAAELRDQMPLPAFERMVRQDYALIAHSSSAGYGAVLDNGMTGMVNVDIKGRSGKVLRYRSSAPHSREHPLADRRRRARPVFQHGDLTYEFLLQPD